MCTLLSSVNAVFQYENGGDVLSVDDSAVEDNSQSAQNNSVMEEIQFDVPVIDDGFAVDAPMIEDGNVAVNAVFQSENGDDGFVVDAPVIEDGNVTVDMSQCTLSITAVN